MTAVKHPLRRQILRAYLDGSFASASADQLAAEMDQEVGRVAYHLKTLSRCDLLSPVEGSERLGSDHRYGFSPEVEPEWLRLVLELSVS